MRAFILAGGFATRLWPLTEKRAKPLLPLAGKPILNYIIDSLPKSMPIAVSTNAAFGDDFLEWQKQYNYPLVEVVIEQTASDDAKLGTLGALSQWLRMNAIDDDILFITGDNYFGFPLQECIDAFTGIPLVAAHDIHDELEASRYGTVVTQDRVSKISRVVQFEEKPKQPKTTLVSTGASILPRSVLPILHEYAKHKPDNVGGIFEELLVQNIAIDCIQFAEPWFDIGSFWAYVDATKTLVGTTPHLAHTAILQNTITHGSVVLGERSHVSNSLLENVIIFDDVRIENCVLRNCIIDNHCMLENVDIEGKMIRERTRLVNTALQLPVIQSC
jgi:glucose-1-phosphate thymidylyltransferase